MRTHARTQLCTPRPEPNPIPCLFVAAAHCTTARLTPIMIFRLSRADQHRPAFQHHRRPARRCDRAVRDVPDVAACVVHALLESADRRDCRVRVRAVPRQGARRNALTAPREHQQSEQFGEQQRVSVVGVVVRFGARREYAASDGVATWGWWLRAWAPPQGCR
ncbi:hypothetical protein AMAG_13569 [Allomyces macrogynus ATCC 38327]|uniref:Uncharacterized protein n=1 Tax=Allomyces macrogynus (strain ATCC 38327) TaxID=578462 RepID=A0A0L0T2G6_ALLM3|nr:hypothetical protein, variant [Allomyces macrogynus ATCC 38327]KNE68937.1 hypothetical protein AMAG_13569 [Allomyces macrogynus ATCC 38327]|eukprot:KNE68936.1 hypothetical protein, variant [Allomyces macrogynus ATCC 38327]